MSFLMLEGAVHQNDKVELGVLKISLVSCNLWFFQCKQGLITSKPKIQVEVGFMCLEEISGGLPLLVGYETRS